MQMKDEVGEFWLLSKSLTHPFSPTGPGGCLADGWMEQTYSHSLKRYLLITCSTHAP